MSNLEIEMLYTSGKLGPGAIVVAFGSIRTIRNIYRDKHGELIMVYKDEFRCELCINVKHMTKILRYSHE